MTLTIEIPEGLETAVSRTKQEFAAEVRLMAALQMLELGKLSSGEQRSWLASPALIFLRCVAGTMCLS